MKAEEAIKKILIIIEGIPEMESEPSSVLEAAQDYDEALTEIYQLCRDVLN